jgi:murein L,D-transpeptidase YcbB/YkuD
VNPVLRLCSILLLAGLAGCGPSISGTEIASSIQRQLATSRSRGTIGGEALLAPEAVARFYKARHHRRVWPADQVDATIEAIKGVAVDGLDPDGYHLETLERLASERRKGTDARVEAPLDVLLTDAMAAIVDHVRYGRVRPATLNPSWNMNPRADAPPLEQRMSEALSAGNAAKAIESARPDHFIYRGLLGELARLREIEAHGGWPAVPGGRAIKPGVRDARVPVIRRRLALSGEMSSRAPRDSTRYDADVVNGVRLFQRRHRLADDGVVNAATLAAMNVGVRSRIDQVRVNLERSRWVLNGLEKDFLLVNLPAFKAYLIRDGKNQWEARTQVGKEARQTPTFRARLRTVVFNPDWTVPPTILDEDVLEGMRSGGNTVAEKHLKVLDASNHEVDPSTIDWASATPETFPYTLRQPPGEENALGRIKFLFPNPYSIYLHDTPHRELFESDQRSFSSGCIRIERPSELAEILLQGQDGWNAQKIQEAIDTGETKNVDLEHPVQILIVYWTVSVGASGEVRFMDDFYGLDPAVAAALQSPPRRMATLDARAGHGAPHWHRAAARS